VSVEDDKSSGWLSTNKMTENVEKIRELIHEDRRSQTLLASVMEMPGDLKRNFEHAPHCRRVCSLTLDKWSKAAAHKRVSWATREG
jgi:hypothetical protein